MCCLPAHWFGLPVQKPKPRKHLTAEVVRKDGCRRCVVCGRLLSKAGYSDDVSNVCVNCVAFLDC